MHLTNYSINKNSDKFIVNDDAGSYGSKRSISSVMQLLQQQGHDTNLLWQHIGVNNYASIYLVIIDTYNHYGYPYCHYHTLIIIIRS